MSNNAKDSTKKMAPSNKNEATEQGKLANATMVAAAEKAEAEAKSAPGSGKHPYDLTNGETKKSEIVTATDGISRILKKEAGHVIVEFYVPQRDGVTGKLKFPPFTQYFDPRAWKQYVEGHAKDFKVSQYINLPKGSITVEAHELALKVEKSRAKASQLLSELKLLKDEGILDELMK